MAMMGCSSLASRATVHIPWPARNLCSMSRNVIATMKCRFRSMVNVFQSTSTRPIPHNYPLYPLGSIKLSTKCSHWPAFHCGTLPELWWLIYASWCRHALYPKLFHATTDVGVPPTFPTVHPIGSVKACAPPRRSPCLQQQSTWRVMYALPQVSSDLEMGLNGTAPLAPLLCGQWKLRLGEGGGQWRPYNISKSGSTPLWSEADLNQ